MIRDTADHAGFAFSAHALPARSRHIHPEIQQHVEDGLVGRIETVRFCFASLTRKRSVLAIAEILRRREIFEMYALRIDNLAAALYAASIGAGPQG